MKRVHELEVKAFSQLSNSQRYNYFVAKVFEWQECWGLKDAEGWVISSIEGQDVFPLWPAEPFAKNCQVNDWQTTEIQHIGFVELVTELLPALIEDNIAIAVFMVPHSESCGVLPAESLLGDFTTLQAKQQNVSSS